MIIELQFLNKVISEHDFGPAIKNNLDETYFPELSYEFKFIQNHYRKYNQTPDLETCIKSFGKDSKFEVLDVKESFEYLVSELYRYKNDSALAEVFNKVKNLIINGESDAALNTYLSSVNKLSANTTLTAVDVLNDTSRYDTYVDKCNNFNKYFVSTGFRELDDSLGGGIDKLNSYFVISARPGVGKTLVMVKFISAAIDAGMRVGLYEGEMDADKIAGRYDTMISHISNSSISHGNASIANAYRTHLDGLKNKRGKFFLMTRETAGSDFVTVNTLESFIDKYNLDILFVDQLSLLDVVGHFQKSFEAGAEISKRLKNLQVRKKIPIVVASQLNRDATKDDKVAGTENLSISDRIGQDATVVISLTKKDSTMTIDIAKARDGAKIYKLQYMVDFDKCLFDYIEPDEKEEAPVERPRRQGAYEDFGGDVYA